MSTPVNPPLDGSTILAYTTLKTLLDLMLQHQLTLDIVADRLDSDHKSVRGWFGDLLDGQFDQDNAITLLDACSGALVETPVHEQTTATDESHGQPRLDEFAKTTFRKLVADQHAQADVSTSLTTAIQQAQYIALTSRQLKVLEAHPSGTRWFYSCEWLHIKSADGTITVVNPDGTYNTDVVEFPPAQQAAYAASFIYVKQ